MDITVILPAVMLGAIGYVLGLFSGLMIATGDDIESDRIWPPTAAAFIDASNRRVRRYRAALVLVFLILCCALAWAAWPGAGA